MARAFIENWKQLAPGARYGCGELAKLCQLSLRQLQRDFHVQIGRTPQDWLNEQRLEAAHQKLLSGQPIKAVAMELGFKQSSHFCREFKACHQLTPSEFVALDCLKKECCSRITNVADR